MSGGRAWRRAAAAARGTAGAVAMLAGLAAIAAAGLWGWAGTPESLAWAWRRWAEPQGLKAEDLQGSLRHGLRARRITLEREGALRVQGDAVALEWQPAGLLRGRLHLRRVAADAVAIDPGRGPPPGAPPSPPPQALRLPLAVVVDELAVGRIAWGRGAAGPDAAAGLDAPQVGALKAAYAYDGRQHRLRLQQLMAGPLAWTGEASLGDREGLPLDLRLQGQGQGLAARGAGSGGAPAAPGAAHPVSADLRLHGPLAQPTLEATLRAGDTRGGAASGGATRATVSAQLTPWHSPRWRAAQARLQGLDLATAWPGPPGQPRPVTAIAGRVTMAPLDADAWQLEADLTNAAAGPWDAGRLPVSALRLRGQWRGQQALVQSMHARIGRGTVRGEGRWLDARRWRWQARVAGLTPSDLHRALARRPMDGQLQARADGPVLQAQGRLLARADRPEDATPDSLDLRELALQARWQDGRLSVPQMLARTGDARLQARFDAGPLLVAGVASLDAPGLQLRAEGRIGAAEGAGVARLRLPDIARARAWLARVPGVGFEDRLPAQGEAAADLAWQGGWSNLTWRGRGHATLAGEAQAPLRQLRHLRVEGVAQARREADGWQARIDALRADWALAADAAAGRFQLASPVTLRRAADGRIDLGAGAANVALASDSAPVRIAWDAAQWHPGPARGLLRTSGRLQGLSLRALLALSGAPGVASGDLAFDGAWDLRWGTAQPQRLRIDLARARGDLSVLAETADGLPARVAAGVREAGLRIEADGDALSARLRWASDRAGQLDAEATTRLSPGGPLGWRWPDTAPLAGRLQARLPRLAVWSLLAPAGWRLRGTLAADLELGGTRAQPRLAGTLQADQLGLRSIVDGIALQDGRLRARLDDRRLHIDELSLRGPGGQGLLLAQGEAGWPAGGDWRLDLRARLERLRASVRPDREVTVSGTVRAALVPRLARLDADLRVDRARIVLPARATPQLADDVAVRGQPMGAGRAAAPRPWQAQARIDLGDDFRVAGGGADLRLRGAVDVTAGTPSPAAPRSPPRASGGPADAGWRLQVTGTVRAAEGHYEAWGQRLAIERGVLRFTGPPDDPALDVLAVRPDPAQREGVRVGVQLTGSGRAPRLRLWSEPEMAEAQKLSWLLLGRPAAGSGAETALLEDAALSLLARRAGVARGGLARRLGLDELALRRDGGGEGAALTLGKRLAGNLYAVYERSLSGALGTLWVFYDLTRHLTLRAQAGERNGVDLVYTLSFD